MFNVRACSNHLARICAARLVLPTVPKRAAVSRHQVLGCSSHPHPSEKLVRQTGSCHRQWPQSEQPTLSSPSDRAATRHPPCDLATPVHNPHLVNRVGKRPVIHTASLPRSNDLQILPSKHLHPEGSPAHHQYQRLKASTTSSMQNHDTPSLTRRSSTCAQIRPFGKSIAASVARVLSPA